MKVPSDLTLALGHQAAILSSITVQTGPASGSAGHLFADNINIATTTATTSNAATANVTRRRYRSNPFSPPDLPLAAPVSAAGNKRRRVEDLIDDNDNNNEEGTVIDNNTRDVIEMNDPRNNRLRQEDAAIDNNNNNNYNNNSSNSHNGHIEYEYQKRRRHSGHVGEMSALLSFFKVDPEHR